MYVFVMVYSIIAVGLVVHWCGSREGVYEVTNPFMGKVGASLGSVSQALLWRGLKRQ